MENQNYTIDSKLVYGSTLIPEQWEEVEYRTRGNVNDPRCTQLGIVENPSFGISKELVSVAPSVTEGAQPGAYTEPQQITLGNPGETVEYYVEPI